VSRPPLPFVPPGATLVPADEIRRRLAGLQAMLAGRDLDAALLVQNADLYYYAGTVQQSFLYVPVDGQATLFVRKVAERARLESSLDAVMELGAFRDLPARLRERYGVLPSRLGMELDVLPALRLRSFEKLLPQAVVEDVGRDIVRLRAIKSAWEIERIRAAARLADRVCARVAEVLREGLREVELAGLVEAEARRLGHEGVVRMRAFNQEIFYGQLLTGGSGCVPSFPDTPLAGTGLSPAVAQGPGFRRISRGEPVLFDFVAVRDGYMADTTRMFVIGELPGELVRAYDAALGVQEAAIAAACPGATCAAVWEAALSTATREGLGDAFMGHGVGQVRFVGHGVGVELDELPVLAASSYELAEGMVFALEPKFVLPGLGAVGVENTWALTAAGPERLTLAPQDIVAVG